MLLVIFNDTFVLDNKRLLRTDVVDIVQVYHFGQVRVQVRMDQGRLLVRYQGTAVDVEVST